MNARTYDLGLPLFRRGKVRDTYDLGDRLLMVASDRISAFDVVLPTQIPGKGVILNQLSAFWFEQTRSIVGNHVVSTDLSRIDLPSDDIRALLEGRSMIVEKAERIDVECVVRGYLAGSAWAEYRQVGTVHGEPMPKGLVQAEMLPEPRFTPAIKSDEGHDVNISNDELKDRIGGDLALSLQSASLKIYQFAAEFASARGLILADTKFEFGYIDGELRLIDELLTPDSSRFWDAGMYRTGESPPSFDKQYVRDWLSTQDWNRQAPGPTLPPDVVEGTQARYLEAYRRLTGADLFLERFASVTSPELENSGHE